MNDSSSFSKDLIKSHNMMSVVLYYLVIQYLGNLYFSKIYTTSPKLLTITQHSHSKLHTQAWGTRRTSPPQ